MSQLKLLGILVLILHLIAIGGCNDEQLDYCENYYSDQVQVSVYHLLMRPECFHNRQVEFKGIKGRGYGNIIIFPTRTDFLMKNIASAIYLNLELSPEDFVEFQKITDGRLIEIGGVFHSSSGLTVSILPRVIDTNIVENID